MNTLQAVCQCTVGYRSGQYAQRLNASPDAGLASAANLRGGILAYVSARAGAQQLLRCGRLLDVGTRAGLAAALRPA